MATGDQADFTARLLRFMPDGWFPDVAPRLNAVLQGFSSAFAGIYMMLAFTKAQMRVSTASGSFLDLAAQDYFGVGGLSRLQYEGDPAYAARIKYNLTAPRGTLAGMTQMLESLTGNTPTIWQPNLPSNCGGGWSTMMNSPEFFEMPLGSSRLYWSAGYGLGPNYGGFGVSQGGTWGTLTMPAQVFITIPPPVTGYGVFADYGGFGTMASDAVGGGYGMGSRASPGAGGGRVAFIDPSTVPGALTADVIYQEIVNWMPAGYTAWILISDVGY